MRRMHKLHKRLFFLKLFAATFLLMHAVATAQNQASPQNQQRAEKRLTQVLNKYGWAFPVCIYRIDLEPEHLINNYSEKILVMTVASLTKSHPQLSMAISDE